jgi:hypothetical protein
MPVEYQKQGAAGRRARRHLLVLHVCRGHGTAVTRSAPIGSAVRDERAIAIVAKGSRDHGGRRDRGLADALAASVGAPMIKAITGVGRAVQRGSGSAAAKAAVRRGIERASRQTERWNLEVVIRGRDVVGRIGMEQRREQLRLPPAAA